MILTERDYRNIIYNQSGYQSILHAIFSTNSILFLGASLSDPELLLMLGYIHNIFHGGSPMHYALMANDIVTGTEKDRWKKDFNIEISNI
ncbi:MAG: SIR2 family protein [Saprospiraceae bacterium]|nr:SIR2 family protein [Saprospiraceae bacterium]